MNQRVLTHDEARKHGRAIKRSRLAALTVVLLQLVYPLVGYEKGANATTLGATPVVNAALEAATTSSATIHGKGAHGSVVQSTPLKIASKPRAIFSNTTYVRALAASGGKVWAATTGGLEVFDVQKRTRSYVYTTNDGLPSLAVDSVKVTDHDVVVVSTSEHDCALAGGNQRFVCSRRPTSTPQSELWRVSSYERVDVERSSNGAIKANDQIEGANVTSRILLGGGREWLGTAGRGVWERTTGGLTRVTPVAQIAGNHVVAVTEWQQSTWFATFDRGLSVLRDDRFQDVPLEPRMLNDVLGTNEGLFVATSEGLFRSEDGQRFERDVRVAEKAITDLAYDQSTHVLYAAATNSLWEIDLGKPRKYPRSTYQPGGTRSLQAVDVSPDGTVFLATEDRGVLRRDAHKRYTAFDRLAGYASSWVIDVLALDEQAALGGTLRHGVFSTDGHERVGDEFDAWVLFLGRDVHDASTVFVGTQEGAGLVQNGKIRTLEGLPNGCVHTLVRASDGIWVGTEGGLALYR